MIRQERTIFQALAKTESNFRIFYQADVLSKTFFEDDDDIQNFLKVFAYCLLSGFKNTNVSENRLFSLEV